MLSLTATELPRFMACNGSRLMGKITPVNRDTSVADEGDAAHWFIEQVFKGNFHAEELIDRKAPNGVFITDDMLDNTEKYLKDIMDIGDVELDTSYAMTGYEIRGRADHVLRFMNRLTISDFKYGWKITEPEENWTLISHAIGYLSSKPQEAAPEFIDFKIYQPRPYHPDGSVRVWTINYHTLMEYWQILQTTLSNPSDELKSGNHCYKCPSLSQCPAAQIASMNAIDVAEMAYNSEVDNKQLSYIMDEIKRARVLLEQSEDAYSDLATSRIKKGELVPEYSLQTSIGNSNWKEGLTPEIVQMMTGKDVIKKQLVTPNQAKKIGIPQEVIDSLCERQNRGFKLVRVDGSKKAEQLFGKK